MPIPNESVQKMGFWCEKLIPGTIASRTFAEIENRTDVFVSTLRSFVNAMGGELEIKAVFPEREVRTAADHPRTCRSASGTCGW